MPSEKYLQATFPAQKSETMQVKIIDKPLLYPLSRTQKINFYKTMKVTMVTKNQYLIVISALGNRMPKQ